MSYRVNLETNQELYLSNQGDFTQISLIRIGLNQQQNQSSSLQTGAWIAPPSLYRFAQGFILRIDTAQKQYFVQIQSNGLQILEGMPSLIDAEPVILEKDRTNVGFVPIEPMQPMKPMKPMEMRMGNMYMNIEQPLQPIEQNPRKRFCPQCGVAVGEKDRFCSNCGHKFNQL
jgi:hypothetical protein